MKNRILIKFQQRVNLFICENNQKLPTHFASNWRSGPLSAVCSFWSIRAPPTRILCVCVRCRRRHVCVASGTRRSRGLRACVLILGHQRPSPSAMTIRRPPVAKLLYGALRAAAQRAPLDTFIAILCPFLFTAI